MMDEDKTVQKVAVAKEEVTTTPVRVGISVGDINALTAAPADCGIIANAALAISTFARNGNNHINDFYGLI